MPETEETVLIGWPRDAGGGAQRFTSDDIYGRAGVWCMDRLRQGIPAIRTYYCRGSGSYFTSELAAVPEMVLRLRMRLRKHDAVAPIKSASGAPWPLPVYKTAEDG